jgi:hypothetical protein
MKKMNSAAYLYADKYFNCLETAFVVTLLR